MRALITLFLIVFSSYCWTDSNKNWNDVGITELYLKNGMRVCLKPMADTYEEEVHIALSALGGYTILPYDKRAVGHLATSVVIESGLGTMDGDQLSVMQYENGMEILLQIDPFWRGVEGLSPEEALPSFFKILNLIFTGPRYNEKIFNKIVKSSQEEAKKPADFDRAFEETFLTLNTQNYFGFRNLEASELEHVNLEDIKQFFSTSFSNPADFTLVVSGNFKIETILPIIEEHLGSLKSSSPSRPWKVPALGNFPRGITTKVMPTKRSIGTTKIAFPILEKITPSHVLCIDDWCHIIEGRLRNGMQQRSLSSRGIDVSYEFPYYPYNNEVWLTIQYQSDFSKSSEINAVIFSELNKLKSAGVTQEEVEKAKHSRNNQISLWYDEPQYWTPLISNHSLWGWDLNSRSLEATGLDAHDLPLIKEFSALIPLDRYTQISTHTGK